MPEQTRKIDLALRTHIEKSVRTVALTVESRWKNYSRVDTGRARASIIASIGKPDTTDPNKDAVPARRVTSLLARAEKGRQRLLGYKLVERGNSDIFIRSGIGYAFTAFSPVGSLIRGSLEAITRAVSEGIQAGQRVRG